MKKIIKITILLYAALFIGCSSDDDNSGETPVLSTEIY